jgi:hypothetical protein
VERSQMNSLANSGYEVSYYRGSDCQRRLHLEEASSVNQSLEFRHRDAMGRLGTYKKGDYYLSPNDAKLKSLVVTTSTKAIQTNTPNSTWKRKKLKSVVPVSYRLALWPLSHIPVDREEKWSGSDWAFMGLKWLPTVAALTFTVRSKAYRLNETDTFLDCFQSHCYRCGP